MADPDCVAAILKAAPHLSKAEAAAIDDAVAAAKKRARASDTLASADTAAIEFAREQADFARMNALIEKRNLALNTLAEARLWDFVSKDKAGALRLGAAMVGSVRGFEGAAASVDRIGKALEAQFEGFLASKLQEAGLLAQFRKGGEAFDRDVANELARLTDPAMGRDTKNKAAKDTAAILHAAQEGIRKAQNDAGAWIGKEAGYITRQAHDQYRIRKAGFDAWVGTIGPLLDDFKTFPPGADKQAFLRAVWNNLASGDHLKPESVGSVKDPAFKGPGNLARRISAERVLHFKSADDWHTYNQAFGTSSLAESVLHGIKRGAQNTALMRKFGTNPEAMFERVRDRLVLAAKERGDIKEVERLKGSRLANEFAQISGATAIAGNPTVAAWAAGVRSTVNMATLGGVVLSSMTDPANAAATLARNGVSPLKAYRDVMKGFVMSGGSAARKEMNRMGIGIQAMLGDIVNRFDATDGVRGTMSKAQNNFFRLTGIVWESDSLKRGVGAVLASHIADHAHLDFAKLPKDLQINLGRYDITAADWTKLRNVDTKLDDGTRMMLAERIDDPALADKMRVYYVGEAAEALNEPTAGTAALMTMGTRPGTVMGEIARFVGHLKKFPTEFARGQVGRSLLGRADAETPLWSVIKSGDFNVPAVVHMVVANTVLGYMAMTAKDLAKGKEPRDPDHWKTWLAALQQGGGLGIYGDFLFGEFNRFGGGMVETLAGPVVGQASTMLRAWSMIRDGQDAGATTVNAIKGMVPFANLFYTRAALDYLIMYQIAEMVSPGSLARTERRMEKDYGQRFIIPPSHVIPHGGGGRWFEGVR